MNRRDQIALGNSLDIDMTGITWFESNKYAAWRVRLRIPDPKQRGGGRAPLDQVAFGVHAYGGRDEALMTAARYRDRMLKKRFAVLNARAMKRLRKIAK